MSSHHKGQISLSIPATQISASDIVDKHRTRVLILYIYIYVSYFWIQLHQQCIIDI